MHDPNRDFDDLLRPIRSDPVLTGRLLQIANSASNGFASATLSTHEALIRLGTQALSKLALALSILDNNRHGVCEAFDYDSFWRMSLLRGLAMQLLIKQYPYPDSHAQLNPDEGFSVGLLSEIGRLALAQIHPHLYSECLQDNQDNLLDLERETFLITHQQISIEMLRDWGFSEWILKSIQTSYLPICEENIQSQDAQEYFGKLLKLSSYLSGESGLNLSIDKLGKLLQYLNIDYDGIDSLRYELFCEWQKWGELLCLPVDEKHVFFDGREFAADSEKPAILIVDDDRTQLHILSKHLSGRGYQVWAAKNVDEALNYLIVKKPEIVITDYLMQPTDGFTLTRTIRSNQHTQTAYVILMTGETDHEIMEQAFDAGVNDFITKPIRGEELNARIIGARQFLKRQNQQSLEQEKIRKEAIALALEKRRFTGMAITDALTGLHNRRYADLRLEEAWSCFKRNDISFGIISLDLDFFKKINDNHGHDAGDLVLRHFANILKRSIRSEDIACRMGGEEFIVISPKINSLEIGTLCERIRYRVETCQPFGLGLSQLVTISIGAAVADLTTDEKCADTLKRSDQALYQAKNSGRNIAIVS